MSTAAATRQALERPAIPGQGYARFMQFRGYDVLERFGVLWHRVPGRLYMSFPYYLCPELDPGEVERMLRATGATGVRYPSRTPPGMPSGLYVCDPARYSLAALDSRVRRAIKRGLAECQVREVTAAELLTDGFDVSLATLSRQRRSDPEFGDPARWRRLVDAIEECPCIVPFGAFVENKLAALAITCVEDGWMSVLYRMANYVHSELHASHVLDFRIVHEFAPASGARACSFGVMPLVDNPGLHQYKARMGITVEPQFSVIRLHPALKPFLANRAAAALASSSARLFRHSDSSQKLAAVLQGAAASKHRPQ